MPTPTAYTEETLAAYMQDVLGEVASALGYDPGASYTEAVNEAVVQYGVDDISEVSGRDAVRLLRALARVQAWQKVINDTAGDYDFKTDKTTFNRSQVHKQALSNLSMARAEAQTLIDEQEQDTAYVVERSPARYKDDPYRYWDEEEREL